MTLVVLPGARTPDNWLGVLLALLAAAAYSWQAHSIGRLSDRHGPVETVDVQFTGAAVLFLPTAYLTLGVVTATPAATIGAVYLGLFTTAIAYGPFAVGIPRVGAPTAVTLSLIEPLAATALAAVLVDQPPTPTQLAGITITLANLLWLTAAGRT